MRLEKAAGVELGETVLAEADTPRQIAAAIARAQAGPRPGLGPGLRPAGCRPGPASARPAPSPPGLSPPWARPGSGHGRADADRGAALAGRARRRARPHPAAERRRQRDADHLRQPVSRRVRRGRRPARPRRGAGRARRAAAPHRAGVLPRLHRHPARRRRPGAALPAVPRRSDRGVRHAPGRDPAQRGRPRPADVRRGRARRRAPAPARADPDHGRDGAGHPTRLRSDVRLRSRPGLRSRLQRGCAGADPVHVGEHGLAEGRGAVARQPARQHPRLRRGLRDDRRRRRRHVAAAVPRHGPDRRVVRAALPRHADRLDVAAGLPGQAGALARGDLAASRHHHRGAQLRLRPVRAQDRGRRPRRARSVVVARRAERRRGRPRRHDRALHDALRAARLPARGAAAGLRPGREQPVRDRPAAGTPAPHRAPQPGGVPARAGDRAAPRPTIPSR